MARKWWTLLAVSVGTFMLLIDITIVNVALPDIQRSLRASFSDLQWVIDAYALSLASLLLTAGSLGDRLGRRRVFAAGLVVFTLASLLCGVAGSPTFLNVARAIQGVGGAAIFATSLALLAQEFQGRERGVAFGVWGAVTGAAVAIGPLVGGVLVEAASWQWIFLVNLPVGIGALAVTLIKLGPGRPEQAGRLDLPGVVTFSAALFCLILALIRGNEAGWASGQIVALLAAFVVLLALFVALERRRRDPMLDLGLFRRPAFAGACIAAFALSASMFSLFLYLTLYVQGILGYEPLDAGLRFLPVTLLSFLVAPVAGRLSERVPVRGLMGGGLLLVGLGLVLMSGLSAESRWTALLAGFLVAGAGIGLVNPPLASTAIAVVPPERSGMASGINSTFRQIGIATGIAALGAIFQHRVTDRVVEALAGTPAAGRAGEFASAVYSGAGLRAAEAAPPGVRPALERAARESFVAGLNELLLIGAAVAVVGGLLTFVLVRQRDVAPAGAPHAAAA